MSDQDVVNADDTSIIAEWWQSVESLPFDEVFRIAIVIGIAVLLHFVLRRTIRSFVKRTVDRAPQKQQRNRGGLAPGDKEVVEQLRERTAQRAQAFGTLLRSAAAIAIWSIATLTILSIIGINVTPILASAGVAGVVIGFGAQTLVADYLAGISMIFEDQLGVGDVVNTGQVLGVVEEVALRYTRIRDFYGTVWYIRNGQMQYVANQSQGWTYALLDIPVAVTTDLNVLRDVVNRAGAELFADQRHQPDLLEAPFFGGVEALAGDAVTVRVMGRIRPPNQYATVRTIRQAMKIALDNAGIRVPQQIIQIDEVPRSE
ncbi:MAG: mechanosensitive ion channel domain-containing protein [Candidatus Nanopelagicales bacterium]